MIFYSTFHKASDFLGCEDNRTFFYATQILPGPGLGLVFPMGCCLSRGIDYLKKGVYASFTSQGSTSYRVPIIVHLASQ